MNGVRMCIWADVDLDDEKVIAVFRGKYAKEKCPTYFIDGGKWYPWALQKFGLRYTIARFGPRSAIERFLGILNWRIRRFWNAFHGKYSIESMQNWIEAFAGLRNLHKEKEVLS